MVCGRPTPLARRVRPGLRLPAVVVPVAPLPSLVALRDEADELVVLATPEPFMAVGEWYDVFDQTSDDEVVEALARMRRRVA